MRVLVAVPDQTFTREGGLRTQASRTVDELRNLGCQVDFFDGITKIDPAKYDLAHIFSMNAPTYFKALVLKNAGIPLVFSSVMWRSGNRALLRLATNILSKSPKFLLNDLLACKTMSNWARLILPNTEAELQWLVEVCGVEKNKCTVVPNGVDDFSCAGSECVVPAQLALAGDFVLSVCVMDERKKIRSLVDACVKLGYPLVHVGPTLNDNLKNWVDRRIAHGADITCLGALPYRSPELASLYSICRVFALPSEYETPGIAALEAGLAEAVLVVTSEGGAEEYFGSYGIYSDPRSQKSLEDALQLAWNRNREVQRGLRAHLLQSFSWECVARKTLGAYERMLSSQMDSRIGLPISN